MFRCARGFAPIPRQHVAPGWRTRPVQFLDRVTRFWTPPAAGNPWLAEVNRWPASCFGGQRPGWRTVSLVTRVANLRAGSAGWGWARRHGSDAHGDVAATDRGESSHASKGNRGRWRRVGRREKGEERRNSATPTMDQGWQARQLGAKECLASPRPPSQVRLPRGNPSERAPGSARHVRTPRPACRTTWRQLGHCLGHNRPGPTPRSPKLVSGRGCSRAERRPRRSCGGWFPVRTGVRSGLLPG
jgi:hypothetical protein